jgi:ankyrin repeat protein
MYKQKSKTCLDLSKHLAQRIKRKIILIITAFMLGISNAMYDDKMINGNQNYIKQEQKKD